MARLATLAASGVPKRVHWLFGPRFDLLGIFAPAVVMVLVCLACVFGRISPLPFLWLWLALFDGPHMLATYTRAYADQELWRTRKPLLLGSLAAFLVGPLFLLAASLTHTPLVFTAFLGVMSVYSYFHVVRQHWGFVSLYAARAKGHADAFEKLLLYAVCWLPYLTFVLTHPVIAAELGVSSEARDSVASAAGVIGCGYFVALAVLIEGLVRAWRRGEPPQKQAYLVLVALFHGLVYLVVAGYEPIFPGAVGLDQQFMLLSLMTGVFHSGEYVALVSLFHWRSRRGAENWFGVRPQRFLWLVLPFVAIYLSVACGTSVYPGCQPWPASSWSSQLALGLWWGFALHHYWLDERVWHVRSDDRLRAAFGLAPLQRIT